MKVLFASYAAAFSEEYRKGIGMLASKGVDVSLLVCNSWKDPFFGNRNYRRSPFETFPDYPSKLLFSGHVTGFIWDPFTVARALRECNPDVIHLDFEPAGPAPLQLMLMSKMLMTKKPRFVVFSWETMYRSIRWLNDCMNLQVLSSTDYLIGGNTKVVDVMRKWGYEGPAGVMAQWGIDMALYEPLPPREEVRKQLALPPEKRVVGFVGRLVEEKGLRVLMESMKGLKDTTLLMLGNGPLKEELITTAEQTGIELKLFGTVAQAKVPAYIKAMDVLVLPSLTAPTWEEQFGHVLIEAMAAGVPVIGSRSGAIPEVIGEAGILVEEGSSTELGTAIKSIIDERQLGEAFALRGLERVKTHYTWERLADRLVDIYSKLI